MWKHYADNSHGVVMELGFNNPQGTYDAAMFSIESCIYDSKITNEELYQLVKDKYFEMAGIMLKSNKELAITLLRDNPSVFVRFIAMYLLAFVAPRFKKDEFIEEEETRIIISSPKKEYNNLLDNAQCPAVIENNKNFFREIFMPISVLKRIYVKGDKQKHEVEDILRKRGLSHIPIEVMA